MAWIGIPVPGLRAASTRDESVRLGEVADGGVIPPGVVEHQPDLGCVLLAGVGVVRGHGT
ncbi:MAG: hypothetical protein MUO40_14105 [Anaerolineaceae bacterium]|nr:hypothetical protein [Anaerolineaceae bacterium]